MSQYQSLVLMISGVTVSSKPLFPSFRHWLFAGCILLRQTSASSKSGFSLSWNIRRKLCLLGRTSGYPIHSPMNLFVPMTGSDFLNSWNKSNFIAILLGDVEFGNPFIRSTRKVTADTIRNTRFQLVNPFDILMKSSSCMFHPPPTDQNVAHRLLEPKREEPSRRTITWNRYFPA